MPQLVKHLTFGFGSGCDLRFVRLNPGSSQAPHSAGNLLELLSLCSSPLCTCTLSLFHRNKAFKKNKNEILKASFIEGKLVSDTPHELKKYYLLRTHVYTPGKPPPPCFPRVFGTLPSCSTYPLNCFPSL